MPERLWSMTEQEVETVKSMSRYWTEVLQREDTSPLIHELHSVCSKFGTRILWALKYYAETNPSITKE